MERQNRLQLQFHITGRCNLRCKHCYRTEGDVEPLDYEKVAAVIGQYRALRKAYNARHHIRCKGHINITGGEPFFHRDIRRILELLGQCREEFSYGVLSNGTRIDEEMMILLKETNASFVQLSIDGDRQTHDFLRAPGDFDRVFQKARELEKNGIRTYISFTANRENYVHLPLVAKLCRKNRITKLWSDRLVPIGNGEELEKLKITERELPDYLKTLKKARGSWLTRLLWPKTQVTMNRALQFQSGCGLLYSCSAGNSLITVDEFGQVMPCRRMPIICGDVHSSTLEEIYFGHETFRALRQERVPAACLNCPHSHSCRGGARCQSYAATGSFYRADPACPRKEGDTP